MRTQSKMNNKATDNYTTEPLRAGEIVTMFNKTDQLKSFFQHSSLPVLDDLLKKLAMTSGKKSFLVLKNNKYFNVLTENIAFFYVNYASSVIMSFDRQEFMVNHSMEQIQNLLTEKQFYRLNRQYLINFDAVKEVEHYFARKLLVNLIVPTKIKLLVPKEKVTSFLHWLDNR
jgi:two-component system response regulator LytT